MCSNASTEKKFPKNKKKEKEVNLNVSKYCFYILVLPFPMTSYKKEVGRVL